MRGKHRRLTQTARYRRITPADAGKTFVNSFISLILWDHPRGCGENRRAGQFSRPHLGSPPRMRGKLLAAIAVPVLGRITPADAGKTIDCVGVTGSRQDHPRGCGENDYGKGDKNMTKGSPPRMRGKLPVGAVQPHQPGITPADAGKTAPALGSGFQSRDHPRGCGENSCATSHLSHTSGSPPRMRGKPRILVRAVGQRGITPADAGKTARDCGRAADTEDHPRGCGENTLREYHNVYKAGSPPRMRGKHGFGDVWVRIPRITPADAGKTRRLRRAYRR